MQRDILEQLYKKYHHTAYIYTLSLCKDSYLAEDIVNDAFVKAFLSFVDDKTNFKCWLLVVCRNLFIDFARKKKKISDKDIYEFDEVLKTDSFENVIITSERNQILYNCIILLPEKDDVITSDADNSEIKSIKKTLKRRTAIIISSAVAIVISIILIKNYVATPVIAHVATPIIEKKYYDPTSETLNSGVSDFTMSLEAFTELHFPGYIPSHTYIEKTDVGKYSIDIYRNKWLTGEGENIFATLDKNKLNVSLSFLKYPAINAFAYSTFPFYCEEKEHFEKDKNYLTTLPDYMLIQARISFDRDLTMQEIVDIQNKYSATIAWAGIRNSEREKQLIPLIGLNPDGGGHFFDKINEKYPDFEIGISKGNKAEILESHFKTLLKFQLEQRDFLNALDRDFDYNDYYTKVSDYINENGVKSYGVVAIGSPQEILKMCQEDFVCQLDIDDIDISKYPN